jgi:hypothetical protein
MPLRLIHIFEMRSSNCQKYVPVDTRRWVASGLAELRPTAISCNSSDRPLKALEASVQRVRLPRDTVALWIEPFPDF